MSRSSKSDRLRTELVMTSRPVSISRWRGLARRTALLGCLVAVPVCAQSSRPSPARRAAEAVSPVDAAALSKALVAYDAGQTEAAKPELERLALKYPGNFPANEALGLIYVDTGDFARALPYLEHAANARKIDAVAQANLGAAYLQVGKTAE